MAHREKNIRLPRRAMRPWLSVTTALLVLCAVIFPSSYGKPQSLLVVSVDEATRPSNPPAPSSEAPAQSPAKPADQETNAGTQKPAKSELVKLKDEGIKRYAEQVREEEQQALGAVRPLTDDEARQWLASFISHQPLNCPLPRQAAWIQAIIQAVERNGLPVCKESLALVASIISIESGFHTDPPCIDPSRGHVMTELLDRAEKELHEKYGKVMSVPPVPQLYKIYKDKYYSQLLACKTEGQVEGVARRMADDLRKDAANLPGFVRSVVDKEIGKVANVVRTKGSMQLNFPRAKEVMLARGEEFTDQELSDYMYTMQGGVDVGVAALKPMFMQYAVRYATPDNLSWLFFVGMDYHYGPFSSRNMMEQIRIRDLSGRKIALDGDFLYYNEDGQPEDKNSETLQAVRSIFPDKSAEAILSGLVLEKTPQYIYTDVHQALVSAHKRQFGETPFAAIGDIWIGGNAQLKHGFVWKTHVYLKKLDRYLNAIPWDQ
jgi:hypothetical protein